MKSILFGAGTYGQVYLSYLLEIGIEIVGIVDDNESLIGEQIMGIKILGTRSILPELISEGVANSIYCPIGNNKVRVELLNYAKELGFHTPNFIHHSAIISPNVTIGQGVYILLGTCVMPYTILEDYSMISMGVNIAHHVVLKKGVFLSTGCNIGASITINSLAYIGMAVTLVTGMKSVGEDSLIGAGAVVLKDVPNRVVMAGVPAKVIKTK